MADLDDMEMVQCPHCGRKCPKDFYPVCSCEQAPENRGVKTDKKGVRKTPKASSSPGRRRRP